MRPCPAPCGGFDHRQSPTLLSSGRIPPPRGRLRRVAPTVRAAQALECGALTVAITNVVGSTAARDAHGVIYLQAGPEIGVASTKTFVSHVISHYLLAIRLAASRHRLSPERLEDLVALGPEGPAPQSCRGRRRSRAASLAPCPELGPRHVTGVIRSRRNWVLRTCLLTAVRSPLIF